MNDRTELLASLLAASAVFVAIVMPGVILVISLSVLGAGLAAYLAGVMASTRGAYDRR